MVARRLADLLHVDARGRAVLPARATPICMPCPPAAARSRKVASINGIDRRPAPLARRQVDRVHRHALRRAERSYDQPDLFVAAPDGSGHAAQPDGEVRLRHRRRRRRRSGVRPRRRRRAAPIWSADGKSIIIVAGEQGDAEPDSHRRRAAARSTPVYKGAHTVQAYTATPTARRSSRRDLDAARTSTICSSLDAAPAQREADHARQRCAVQDASS